MNGTDGAPPGTHGLAERLRGFGPLGLLAILAILAGGVIGPLVSAPLVLIWALLSRTPMPELGFRRPRSWPMTVIAALVGGIFFKLAMKAVVMPLFGAPPVNARYHYLAGNAAALPAMLALLLFNAGFGEEVFFRGYAFERLGKLLGRGRAALTATVLVSAALFAAAHYPDQGIPGVQQAAVTGLVFGGVYAWRRVLWGVMIAHAAFDVTAVALIYWNWETPIAHLLFR